MTRTMRLAGVFYLLAIVLGILSVVLASSAYGRGVYLAGTLCYVVVTLLLYLLFVPVNPTVSLVAALFSLAGSTVSILDFFGLHPVPIDPLAFFGCYCLLLAYLIFNADFAPRWLAFLMLAPGFGWLIFFWPPLAHQLFRVSMVLGLLGEGALTLWLLFGRAAPVRGKNPA